MYNTPNVLGRRVGLVMNEIDRQKELAEVIRCIVNAINSATKAKKCLSNLMNEDLANIQNYSNLYSSLGIAIKELKEAQKKAAEKHFPG